MKNIAYISFMILIFIAAENSTFIDNNLIFSHRDHIQNENMECEDCHDNIKNSAKASDNNIPGKKICGKCHDVDDKDNCTTCHRNLNNMKGNLIKRDYFFSHAIHTNLNDVACEKCHSGIVDETGKNSSNLPSKEICNSCHDGTYGSMECLLCHEKEMQFHPDNHNIGWSREHGILVSAGDEECAHCHTNNYCQECHIAMNLVATKKFPDDLFPAMNPHSASKNNMVLKTVHDLNYRYIHQIEAFGKEKECRLCHENSHFCVECHNNNLQSSLRPSWHGGLDWGAIASGVGTGGGRHAELARRDIERCSNCHDVQGADPTCLRCHSDYDGILNTNPKTHDSGMTNRFGDGINFHGNEGAVCFMCHINTHQSGSGFCGYCHGRKD